jgi:hypothetical protein
MPKLLPTRPNVRNCTHIKVAGQRCGSPALRGEFFCYFHTRVIKGVQQRVDMQLHSMALLEDCEAIQLSIMHVVDGLVKGTLDPTRARLIIQALRIAARNAKNVRFDAHHHGVMVQPMVREVPDYALQYLIEHPEYGPPISGQCDTTTPAREASTSNQTPCGADTPGREVETRVIAEHKAPLIAPQNAHQESATEKAAATRRKNAAHGASRGIKPENNPAPKERKNPREDHADPQPEAGHKESERIMQAEAAIPGAMAGDWRDLCTVFEFAGIIQPNKDAQS